MDRHSVVVAVEHMLPGGESHGACCVSIDDEDEDDASEIRRGARGGEVRENRTGEI